MMKSCIVEVGGTLFDGWTRVQKRTNNVIVCL